MGKFEDLDLRAKDQDYRLAGILCHCGRNGGGAKVKRVTQSQYLEPGQVCAGQEVKAVTALRFVTAVQDAGAVCMGASGWRQLLDCGDGTCGFAALGSEANESRLHGVRAFGEPKSKR